MRLVKGLSMGVAVIISVVLAAYLFRFPVVTGLWGFFVSPPLTDKADVSLSEQEQWINEYHTVQKINDTTYAINEPRFFQNNLSYLIIGEDRALLFDTGTPANDIADLVAALTDKPIMVMPSHLHYDHTGSLGSFETIVLGDTNHLKDRTEAGAFTPGVYEYMGIAQRIYDRPTWQISDWVAPGQSIDLGGRRLTLLATPGHTPESVSLYDQNMNALFVGDYMNEGEIYAFMPNSSLKSFLESTQMLLKMMPKDITIYGGHGSPYRPDPVAGGYKELLEFEAALLGMKEGTLEGTGVLPRAYPVNERTSIMADINGPDSPVWDW